MNRSMVLFLSCVFCALCSSAWAQGFEAKALAVQMDHYNLIIPHSHAYIRHCGPSMLAGGKEACTVHGAGPYFIQLVVPNPNLAELRTQLVVGQGYGRDEFRKYGAPPLLSFLMAVTGSEKGGVDLLDRLKTKSLINGAASWGNIKVTQSIKPHVLTWTAQTLVQ